LTYDFWGFPQHYYDVTYDTPGPQPTTRTAGLTTAPMCR
jgi:4,5-DOPA dioxygenase extradiol